MITRPWYNCGTDSLGVKHQFTCRCGHSAVLVKWLFPVWCQVNKTVLPPSRRSTFWVGRLRYIQPCTGLQPCIGLQLAYNWRYFIRSHTCTSVGTACVFSCSLPPALFTLRMTGMSRLTCHCGGNGGDSGRDSDEVSHWRQQRTLILLTLVQYKLTSSRRCTLSY